MRPCILVCSADASYYLLISYILENEGFSCLPARDCATALELLLQQSFAAVLLDCNDNLCCGPDAIDRMCQASKERSIPLVAVLPAGNEGRYLELLKAGVTHIFVSPHPPAQIVHVLRQLAAMGEQLVPPGLGETGLIWGKLELFPRQHRVRYDGNDVVLGPIQFKLLATMMLEPGRIFSRDEFIHAAWPPNIHVEPRTVDVHMGRLRDALRKAAGRDVIRTVRAAGYGLENPLEQMGA
ncbi:response regulator transcription factor [Mesorhizobium qingshengii]|uniref:Two-component system, OmpR family, phosphate regulon response regulator PhoB n=1 Tax=Mesorhizobium qingshengii TaxID=1165689 RepID=A0A1G5WJ62_9HYPH|nr:response regulator transcription factor [Mesorhizobium qingshengii]SDA58052.1 two-component system, OmpR family, phosphate regulon response regulator PhoB [Mesorhizobium qingshengii]